MALCGGGAVGVHLGFSLVSLRKDKKKQTVFKLLFLVLSLTFNHITSICTIVPSSSLNAA